MLMWQEERKVSIEALRYDRPCLSKQGQWKTLDMKLQRVEIR